MTKSSDHIGPIDGGFYADLAESSSTIARLLLTVIALAASIVVAVGVIFDLALLGWFIR